MKLKLFLWALAAAFLTLFIACISVGYASDLPAQVATATPSGSLHIDFSPLVPVINDLITALAGLLTLMVPVVVTYIGIWFRNHGIAMKEATQQTLVSRINATIANGLNFATTAADVGVKNLQVDAPNESVAKAANYVIAQSPDLLKKAGLDPNTPEGQAALVRLITAKLAAPVTQTLDVNAHVDTGPTG